jgi:hypothetical protein
MSSRALRYAQDRRSEESDGEGVVLSEAKDLLRDRERSFVAPLLRTADYRRLDDGACRALRPFASSRPQTALGSLGPAALGMTSEGQSSAVAHQNEQVWTIFHVSMQDEGCFSTKCL